MRTRPLPTWLADLVFERTLAQVRRYAALEWPMSLASYPVDGAPGGCSCRRASCAEPGAHPVVPAPPVSDPVDLACGPTTDAGHIAARLRDDVEANLLLRTGPAFDIIDLPAGTACPPAPGTAGGSTPEDEVWNGRIPVGPLTVMGGRRLLFVLPGRGPYDRGLPGMRWHGDGGYVPAPPSVLPSGHTMVWSRPPELPLADPGAVLDAVAATAEHPPRQRA